jgi:hypothetical protein
MSLLSEMCPEQIALARTYATGLASLLVALSL